MNETWQVADHKVIEVGSADQPVRRVKLAIVGGRIDVVAHDDPEGHLEISDVHGRPLEVSWHEGTLEIRHPQARWEHLLKDMGDKLRNGFDINDRADISLAVPRDVRLQIGSVSAEGLVVGLTGAVDVRSVSGAATLDGVTGAVSAKTVSGSVEARAQVGDMRMDSVSGSFTVQSAGAPSLIAKTVSGSLSVDATVEPLALTFGSVSGGLVLRRATDSAYDADLRSVSGHVVVGGQRIRGDFGQVKFRHDDPGARTTVKANTVSGDITMLAGPPGAAGATAPAGQGDR